MAESKIEPTLTAEEWAAGRVVWRDAEVEWRAGESFDISYRIPDEVPTAQPDDRSSVAQMIAVANAALPDSDPRKITRKTVVMLRESSEDDHAAYVNFGKLRALADALESYLPPEG